MANTTLSKARNAKKDEFYTQLPDISNELKHYRHHFEGKTVLCNCDDPYESNFFKFFAMKFNAWGLKRLICTCWGGSTMAQTELDFGEEYQQSVPYGKDYISERKAYKIDLTCVKDLNGDGCEDLEDVRLFLEQNPPELLQGNGDFRSEECIALLQEADIVVTNPPFSLFREYVAQLVKYNKRFLILGNMNAITYSDIFPLIKENRLWVGYGFNVSLVYKSPYENTLEANRRFVQQKGYDPATHIKVPAVCWYTNLDHNKRHEPMDLYKHYTPEEYPTYDNYNAIEVGKIAEIPMDYDGVMGVPITFLDKYCPEQFEIIWTTDRGGDGMLDNYKKTHSRFDAPVVNGKGLYKRILIRKINN